MKKDLHKNKLGYTLVEIVIVIAVLAIIIVLATSFIVSYRRQSEIVNRNNKAISEIDDVRSFVQSWISYNDSQLSTYKQEDSTKKINITISSGKDNVSIGDSSIHSAYKTLTWKNGGTIYRSVTFQSIQDLTFEIKDNVIYCIVNYEGNLVKLTFTLFSTSERDRYSISERG